MADAFDPNAWLSWGFWHDVFRRTLEWSLTAIPRLLLIVAFTILLLRLYDLLCRKVAHRALGFRVPGEARDDGEHGKRVDTLVGILKKVGVTAIWSLATVLVLMQLGVNVAPILAGAGVLGLAVGFGAQELVRDVISGFFLLLEDHVRKGDVVEINGRAGVVEMMGLRTIALRDLSGVLHVVQNGKIDSLSNLTKEWSACVFDIGVAYKENATHVMQVMQEVAGEVARSPEMSDKILAPFEMLGVESFGDNAVILKARFKTRPGEQWTVGREYRRRLKEVFDEKRIEIPFPHRTVYFGDDPSAASKSPKQALHAPRASVAKGS